MRESGGHLCRRTRQPCPRCAADTQGQAQRARADNPKIPELLSLLWRSAAASMLFKRGLSRYPNTTNRSPCGYLASFPRPAFV
jgi:hypothetical protein